VGHLAIHILNGLRLALIGLENLQELLVNVGLCGKSVLAVMC
jgi:succinate dehydrogenase/fumarate reductase cytochrome b subunit